jgi:hypothetical protein
MDSHIIADNCNRVKFYMIAEVWNVKYETYEFGCPLYWDGEFQNEMT